MISILDLLNFPSLDKRNVRDERKDIREGMIEVELPSIINTSLFFHLETMCQNFLKVLVH